MALDTRRHRRHDQPDANISNKTLPGFAVMGAGLLIVIVGAILIAALGSPGSGYDISEEPEKIAGVTVIALGLIVLLVGIILSIWLKTRKPKDYPSQQSQSYPNNQSHDCPNNQSHDYANHQSRDYANQQQSRDYANNQSYDYRGQQSRDYASRHQQSHDYSTEPDTYGHPSTVSNGYHTRSYPESSQYPVYGPPAPMRKS